MNKKLLFLFLVFQSFPFGCAHPIKITPHVFDINAPNYYPVNVSYVISDAELNKDVITPAGGGDKVQYKPYMALDTVLKVALKQMFKGVQRVENLEAIHNADFVLIFDPSIITDSSSSSFLMWPPDKFTITIDCSIYDSNKNVISQVKGVGHGTATSSDWNNFQFGIAGERAMHTAIVDLFNNFDHQVIAQTAGVKTRKEAVARERPTSLELTNSKPSIYIAYPTGDEEIADEEVELFGYVTTLNRTEQLKVFRNNQLLPVETLWADIKIDYKGLRGYPLKLKIPLKKGVNKLDLHVLDKEGFLVTHSVSVKYIQLVEQKPVSQQKPKQVAELPQRLPNIQIEKQNQDITSENFMAVLGDWVKQTSSNDYNKGNSMFDQNRFERAAYYYNKSIKTNALSQAYYNLGITQKKLDKSQEAQNSFTKACEMNEAKACEMINKS